MTTIETVGRRHYLRNLPYEQRDAAKRAGCRWDPSERAWWSGKLETAEAAIAYAAEPETKSDEEAENERRSRKVIGSAKYKGRTYYISARLVRGRTAWDDEYTPVLTRDGAKIQLVYRDGSSDFWALRDAVEITKEYRSAMSIGQLRDFAEQRRAMSPSERREEDYRREHIRWCEGVCRCPKPVDEGDQSCIHCGGSLLGRDS